MAKIHAWFLLDGGVNFTDHIHAPPSEWPRLDNRVHCRRGNHLNFPKLLTRLTPFIIFETVLKHAGLVEPRSPNQPLHLVSRLVSPTSSFVHLMQKPIRLGWSQTFKQQAF